MILLPATHSFILSTILHEEFFSWQVLVKYCLTTVPSHININTKKPLRERLTVMIGIHPAWALQKLNDNIEIFSK
jgi:hypothetical protein